MVEEDQGHRAGDRCLLLPRGRRLGPRIDQVVVEAEIAVQVGRQRADEIRAGGRRQVRLFPEVLVAVVLEAEVDPVAVGADVLVSRARGTTAGVALEQFHRVAGVEHLGAAVGLVGRLDIVEGRDEVAAERGFRVEGIERLGFDRELAAGVDHGIAGDEGVGSVVVLAKGDRDRQAEVDLAGQLHLDAVFLDGRLGVEIGRRVGRDVGPVADSRFDGDEAVGLDLGQVADHAITDARGGVVRVQHHRQRECALEALAIDRRLGLVCRPESRGKELVFDALAEGFQAVRRLGGRLLQCGHRLGLRDLVLRRTGDGARHLVEQIVGRSRARDGRRRHTSEVGGDREKADLLDRSLALLAGDVDIAGDVCLAVERGQRIAVLHAHRHRDGDGAVRVDDRIDLRAVAVDGLGLHGQVAAHGEHGAGADFGGHGRVDHADTDGDAVELHLPVVLGVGLHVHRVVALGADDQVTGGLDLRIADLDHRFRLGDGHGHRHALQAARCRQHAGDRLRLHRQAVGNDHRRRSG